MAVHQLDPPALNTFGALPQKAKFLEISTGQSLIKYKVYGLSELSDEVKKIKSGDPTVFCSLLSAGRIGGDLTKLQAKILKSLVASFPAFVHLDSLKRHEKHLPDLIKALNQLKDFGFVTHDVLKIRLTGDGLQWLIEKGSV